MLMAILTYLKNLNFFSFPSTSTNEYEVQNERLSTRIFIVTLLISILIILTYTSQVNITKNIEVKQPSYELFQSFRILHSQTLRCLCDNVAISYESFITLKPEFHQLCSSVLISRIWIDYLDLAKDIYLSDDFSYTGSSIFITLASFCQLANKTIMNALETFKSTRFITNQVIDEQIFHEQINTIIRAFQTSTELAFYQSFDLIQFTTQTNSFLSGLFSNIIFSINTTSFLISDNSRFYGNGTCSCDDTPLCVDPLTLLDHRENESNLSSYFTIPGLLKGCFLIEAVRQSSLECFYQSSCISTIQEFLQIPVVLNSSILSLNSSVISRFNISSTIDQLLTNAMIEIWQQNISYIKYFQQCDVSSCTYSTTSRFNIVYVLTTLIGLVGGLTKILRLLIPSTVKSIRRRFVPSTVRREETSRKHTSS